MSALRPDGNKSHDLGTSSIKWGTVHAGDVQAETITTSGNVEVQGNLTVTGTQTSLQVSTVEAEDPMIKLARGNTADSLDIGFYGQSTSSGSAKYHGLFRDQDDSGKFKLFIDLANEPGSTVATLSSSNKATLVADIEGDVTGDLTGNADTATTLATARTIQISGDSAGSASFNGSADINIATTIQTDAVENSMIANPGYNFGDGTTPALRELGTTIVIQGTSNEVEVSRTDGTFTVGLPSTVSGLSSVSATALAGELTGNSSTATKLATARAIQISGDVAGTANFDGSAAINISSTIQSGAVDNSMLANSTIGITVDGTGGESIPLGQTIDFNGTSNQVAIAYSAGGNDLTFSLPSEINVDTSGNAATATAQETARTFSITGSEVTASGISYDGTSNVALSASITAGSVANSKLANSSITFSDGSNSTAAALGGTVTIQGTSNEIEVGESSGTFTIGLPSTITAAVNGNASTATALATARNVGITSGPVRAANVSFDGSGNVALTSSIAADQITNTMLENPGIELKLGGVSQETIELGGFIDISGTSNQVDVAYSTSANDYTFSLPSTINVDTSGNAATATALATGRNFDIGAGPVRAAAISFDGSGNVSLTSSIASGQISNAMLANSSITVGDGSNTSAIALGGSVTIQGTSNEVDVSESSGTFTVGLPSTITAALNGNAATATKWASARTVTFGGGDVTGSFSIDGNADVGSVDLTIGSGVVDNAMLANSGFTFSDTSNSEELALGSTLFIGGTSNEVDVAYDSSLNKFTVGLPNSVNVTTNLDVGGGLTVGGNVAVTGNISGAGLTATGANVSFSDNLLELGVSNTDLEDIGFYGQRGDGVGGNNGFAGVAFDESADEFIAFTASSEPTTTVGSHSAADFKVGKLTSTSVDCSGEVAGELKMEGTAPTSVSSSGTAGDLRFDSNKLYVCVGTNSWKAVNLSTF